MGATNSIARADNNAPAPNAARIHMIYDGILRVKPTSEPRVSENAAMPPEKKAQ